jgi:hypothetical protein
LLWRAIEVPTIIGVSDAEFSPGEAVFTRDGHECRLQAQVGEDGKRLCDVPSSHEEQPSAFSHYGWREKIRHALIFSPQYSRFDREDAAQQTRSFWIVLLQRCGNAFECIGRIL